MRSSVPLLYLWSACCCFAAGSSTPAGLEGRLQDERHEPSHLQVSAKPPVRFNLRTSGDSDHEGCYLSLGHNQPLEDCSFNMTAKTFFIIHGWTMSGMFESWLYKLVSALQTREKEANVVVVDWLPLAHQLYTDAVNNTRVVGLSVARMLDWLQEKDDFSLGNVHLIGYSLGAHVAGYAGNFVRGTVGRITGLDPAGPLFEGVDIHKRLSPDDADFVDVLHTYTRSFGLSIGIQMPVGHIDIYPNGGDFQPGCGLNDVLGSIAYGTITEVVKCEHERAVHLFVDSLVNQDKPSFAFQCTDSNRFKKGICLSCRKNRCNSIGYNAKKTRSKRNSKMYLKTRAGMPFRVYHYQMKIHIFSYKMMGEIEPNFYITLYGTSADSQLLPLEIVEQIGLNATNTFLVYTEEDLGDLLKIKLTWEGTAQSWYNLWKELRSYLSQPHSSEQELHIRRIRVKSGETQRRYGPVSTVSEGVCLCHVLSFAEQAPPTLPCPEHAGNTSDTFVRKREFCIKDLYQPWWVDKLTIGEYEAPVPSSLPPFGGTLAILSGVNLSLTIVFMCFSVLSSTRLTFCVQGFENTSISPGQELWFHKCRDGWRMKNETRVPYSRAMELL